MQKYRRAIQDIFGNAVTTASVRVKHNSSGADATIYSDNSGTPKINPFSPDSDGIIEFFVANGRYDIEVTVESVTKTDSNVLLWEGDGGIVVETIAQLRAMSPHADGTKVFVLGYYGKGDGGGGEYHYAATNIEPDNGGTIIQPDSLPASGRWVLTKNKYVSLEQFGAKLDGITNDTLPIQNAFDSGVFNLYSGPGIAVVGALTITTAFTYKANDTAFKTTGTAEITIQDTTNVSIYGLEYDGNNFTNNSHGFLVQRASYITIEDCYIHHVHKNGISEAGTESKIVHTYRNNRFEDIGGTGINRSTEGSAIYAYYSDRLEISGNDITRCWGGKAIGVYGPNESGWIFKNRINDIYGSGILFGLGAKTNHWVYKNQIKGCGELYTGTTETGKVGILIQEVSGADDSTTPWEVQVFSNTIENTIENGIEGACLVYNNTIKSSYYKTTHATQSRAGISLYARASARGNTIIDAGGDGIYSNYPYHQDISSNTIINARGYAGIRVKLLYVSGGINTAENFSVQNNTIRDTLANNTNGIYLFKDGSTTVNTDSCIVSANNVLGQSAESVKDSLGCVLAHNSESEEHPVSFGQNGYRFQELSGETGASNIRWTWSYGMQYDRVADNWNLAFASYRSMICHDNNAISMFLVPDTTATPLSSTDLRNNHTVLQITGNKVVQCPGGVSTFSKAAPITDADFPSTPGDNVFAIDRAAKRIYVRIAGAWYYTAALTPA